MIAAALGVVGLMEALFGWAIVADGTGPASDPIVFFLSQGVLGVVVFVLYREWKEERTKREAQTQKLIDDYIPLLTRGTEAMERMAEAEEARLRRGRRETT